MFNHINDGSFAHFAELFVLEGVHEAVYFGAVDVFHLVSSAFINAHGVLIFLCYRSGDRGLFVKHVFPFAFKIDECGDVWFPRLDVDVIVCCALVGVFVSEACKAVSELVDDDL